MPSYSGEIDPRGRREPAEVVGSTIRREELPSLFKMFEAPLEQEDTAYITSADPTGQPQIDPQYFNNAVDITILAAGRHFMDQGSQSSHLRDRIAEGIRPPQDADLQTLGARLVVRTACETTSRLSTFFPARGQWQEVV